MFTKKTIRTLISLLLILSFSVMPLASCAKQEESNQTDNSTSEGDETNIIESEGTTERTYEFPEVDYGGYEMRVLNISPNTATWAIPNLDVEEETGDVIMDSIYKRNSIVEDRLNLVIKEIADGDPPAKLKKAVNAGTDDYDVAFTYSNAAGTLSSSGMYLNLYDINALNFDEAWWDHGAIQSFELMNKLYFTTTDAHVMTNDSIWVIYFNKQMVQDLQLSNPYQLVRENKWTVDAMVEMMRASIMDLDGDGEYTVNDKWGVSSHSFATMAFLICTDSRLITKDKDGVPQLLDPTERFITAYEKIRLLLDKTNGMFLDAQGTYKGKTAEFDHPTKTFLNDKSLFCAECLSHTRVFREMENDFGILPHPKYDSFQSEYLTLMVDTTPAFGIPITNSDPERTGAFMEAMTGVSATTIIPAYYETSLTNKFTRDEDSIEMLDIIRDHRVYELAIVYNWASFYGTLQSHGFSPTGVNPMTVYEKNAERTRTAIQKTVDAFESVDY